MKIIKHPATLKGGKKSINDMLKKILRHCQSDEFRKIYENDIEIINTLIEERKISLPELPNEEKEKNPTNEPNLIEMQRRARFTGDPLIDELVTLLSINSEFKKYVFDEIGPIMNYLKKSIN